VTRATDETVPAGPAPTSAAATGLRRAPAAGASCRAWVVLLIATLASIGADLGSKWIAFREVAPSPVVISREDVLAISRTDPRNVGMLVPPHEPVAAVPGLLEFTLVLNPGAVFGMGPGQRWFFVGFTAIALGFGLWMFSRWTRGRDHVAHAAIGMLLGGGLGNLYDRLTLGVVRDFLHPLPGLKWPFGLRPLGGSGEIWPYVSNVADALLLVGIAILLVYLYRREREERAGAKR
jgi:signal peptidase II